MAVGIARRQFISALGGAAAATSLSWPLAARAQQPALPAIGFINAASAHGHAAELSAFLEGLGETGYVDGHNVAIEYRWADDHYDRVPALIADLIQRQVAVIAATSTPAGLAAKAATTTIPIVFETGLDPIQLGLVASLNRPGGNVTGITQLNIEVGPKRLELLHELVPTAHVIALLINPADRILSESSTTQLNAAARELGVELHVLNASAESDFDAVFAKLSELRAGGLVIGGGSFLIGQAERLAALTLRYAIPAVFENRDFVAAGGLISYGGSITESYRLVGVYAGRILKGDKPADLPVQETTKVTMYINMKTAKALGIAIPLPLSGRADEVFE